MEPHYQKIFRVQEGITNKILLISNLQILLLVIQTLISMLTVNINCCGVPPFKKPLFKCIGYKYLMNWILSESF